MLTRPMYADWDTELEQPGDDRPDMSRAAGGHVPLPDDVHAEMAYGRDISGGPAAQRPYNEGRGMFGRLHEEREGM
jgi:hypothetical protein